MRLSMSERTRPGSRAQAQRNIPTIDVVIVAPLIRQLGVLVRRVSDRRSKLMTALPHGVRRPGETLEASALRIATEVLGSPPAWCEQVGAFVDGAHPSAASMSVGFVVVVPGSATEGDSGSVEWIDSAIPAPMAERQARVLQGALAAIRHRMDFAPIPFRMLSPLFTLSDLQHVYELLLGRPLHKASFRRALHASWLVEPTDVWRSEGRGRPAQLFRYAPRRRRGHRRAVRFDLL